MRRVERRDCQEQTTRIKVYYCTLVILLATDERDFRLLSLEEWLVNMKLLPEMAFPDGTLQRLSVLALAHVGDAVYELLARAMCAASGELTSNNLHKATVALVAAPAQAKCAKRLEPWLAEEELAVLKRGRNAHTRTVPKGASIEEYRLSTALEALFGYLYIEGKDERVTELFRLGMEDMDAT